MRTLVCPGCQQVIPTEDVNVSTDIALCRRCQKPHSFSALLQRRELSAQLEPGQRPAGVWERTTARGVAFGATHRSLLGAAAALGIALFWNGIVSVFVLINIASTLHLLGVTVPDWFPAPVMNGENMGWGITVFLWLFLTPFLVIGSLMIGAFFMALGGRTEVRIDPDRGSVFTGFGPLGRTRRFATADVRGVVLRDNSWTDSDGDRQRKAEIVIELSNGETIKFGSALKEPRRNYLAALLHRTLG